MPPTIPKVLIQRNSQRGDGSQGWLRTRFSFSFAGWFHPDYVQWGPLRVINEDHIRARSGFGTHPHRDMEIVTYVLAGAIHHKDSMGSDGLIRPGQAQRMSAGSGVLHSEENPTDVETHLLQIWILPQKRSLGMSPSYESKDIPAGALETGWHPVAEGRTGKSQGPGTVLIHQDAAILATKVTWTAAGGDNRRAKFTPGRLGYLLVVEGTARALGVDLKAGDSIRFSGVDELVVEANAAAPTGGDSAHLLLFDLPPSP